MIYAHGNFEEAVKWGRMSDSENPAYTGNLRNLIAALIAFGRHDEARACANRMMELEPDFRLRHYQRTRLAFRDPEVRLCHIERLRKAGLPE